ncbi:MAG: PAS domain S-box protein, partial [Syntrophothermus sp.]
MNIREDIVRLTMNNIRYPAFVMNPDGLLISSNKEAKELIQAAEDGNFFPHHFDSHTSALVSEMLIECTQTNKSVARETDIELTGGRSGRYEISFSPVTVDKDNFIIVCTICHADKVSGTADKVKILVSNKEIGEVLGDPEILKIINDIKSTFPFTFLGKNKIQAEINRLNEALWLKDKDGRYILVNQKFADILGLRTAQINGKYEREFIPNHLVDFYQSLLNYVKSTSNVIIKEGIPFPQSTGSGNTQVIEIPLCDLDNNVIAILGITQQKGIGESAFSEDSKLLADAFMSMNLPLLVSDQDGFVRYKSEKFCQILGIKEQAAGQSIQRYLPEKLYHQMELFISDTMQREKRIPWRIENKENVYEIELIKIGSTGNKISGFLVVVEESRTSDDKNNLTNGRGKMYEILLQTSPEPMFIYDIDNLRFLEVNPAALSTYGYTKNEFLQMDLTDLYAPEDIQTLLDTGNSRNKEGVFTGPWRHRKRDGSSMLVEISKMAFDFQGRKAHFNIVRDVTEKNELISDLELYKSVYSSTNEMLFVTDRDGFITKVNEAVTDFFKFRKEDLTDRPFITLLSDESRAAVNNEVFHSKMQSSGSFKVSFKSSDGNNIDSNLAINPVKDFTGQINLYSIIARIEKTAEQTASVVKESAVTEKKSSGGTLDPAFLSSMFHEILTPMNVILGFIQELTESIEKPTEEQQEATDIISQNRQLLLQTMDSVLEYSHIEQNRVEVIPTKIMFTDIVDELQKNTKKLAESSGLEFGYGKISSSLSMQTDKNRLESILTMFISIAMRITKEKKIILSAYQYDNANFIIALKDERGKISEHLLKNLNDIFTLSEAEIKRDFGASKLTIRLVRSLLRLLGGRTETVVRGEQPAEFGLLFPLVYTKPMEAETAAETKKITETENAYEAVKPQPVTPEPLTAGANNIVEIEEETEEIGIDPDLERALMTEEPPKIFEEEEPGEEEIEEEEIPVPVQKAQPKTPEAKPAQPGRGKKLRSTAEWVSQESDELKEYVPLVKPVPEMKPMTKIDLSRYRCLYVEDQVDSQILFKVQMKELKKIDFAVSFEAALPLLQQNNYDFIVMDINLQGEYNGL